MSQFDYLYRRDPESHKGHYGHALLVAGSYGKMGAAVLAAKACLRGGVGLLTVHTPQRGVDILQTAIPEAMVSVDEGVCCTAAMEKVELEKFGALAIGPGLGTDDATDGSLMALLQRRADKQPSLPLVLDADAINMLARHPEMIHLAQGACITPHVKEYQRLFADADPQAMADMHRMIIVKKAHRTVVYAPQCDPVVNHTGNAGMATAGSGDVLTGFILALLTQHTAAQGHAANGADMGASMASPTMAELQQVVAHAVMLHGFAGDLAAQSLAQPSLIASDIIAHLPDAIAMSTPAKE